jgi:hypothetical protein
MVLLIKLPKDKGRLPTVTVVSTVLSLVLMTDTVPEVLLVAYLVPFPIVNEFGACHPIQ